MSELYGSPSGEIAYYKSKSEQDHSMALTDLANANTHQLETKARNDQLMMQIFAGMGGGGIGGTEQETKTPEQIIQYLEQKGMQATRAGLVEQGTGMLKDASQMRQHLSSAKHADSITKYYGKKEQLEALETMHGLLTGVTSQETLDRTINDYEAQNPGEKVPDQFRQYDPVKFQQLKVATEGGRKTLKAELDEENKKSMIEARTESARLRALAIAQQKARDKVDEAARIAREKRLGVQGAKMLQPTPTMLADAQAAVEEAHPGMTPTVKIGNNMYHPSAVSIASRAAQIGPERGLNPDEAVRQALLEEEEKGHFTQEEDKGILGSGFFKGDPKWSYKKKTEKPTGAATRPLPLPPAKKDLQEGKHYMTSKGIAVVQDGELNLIETAQEPTQ
jgi:hypothetical protein